MAQEVFTISEADFNELAKMIKERTTLEAREAVDVQKTFCGIWPQAKSALEILKTFIGTIPGVGVFAKVAIGVVITAGDAASSALCH